jgi:hypothetical protein
MCAVAFHEAGQVEPIIVNTRSGPLTNLFRPPIVEDSVVVDLLYHPAVTAAEPLRARRARLRGIGLLTIRRRCPSSFGPDGSRRST